MLASTAEKTSASLPSVLVHIEDELSSLASMSETVQEALSALLGSAQLTSADLVAQNLAALSTFVHHLSLQVPGDWTVRPDLAAKMVSLSALAQRLSLAPVEPEPVAEADDAFLF